LLKEIDIVPAIHNFIKKLETAEDERQDAAGYSIAYSEAIEEYNTLLTDDQYASHIKF
jgi:hypothetical protein